jgi:hypothetical protein
MDKSFDGRCGTYYVPNEAAMQTKCRNGIHNILLVRLMSRMHRELHIPANIGAWVEAPAVEKLQ